MNTRAVVLVVRKAVRALLAEGARKSGSSKSEYHYFLLLLVRGTVSRLRIALRTYVNVSQLGIFKDDHVLLSRLRCIDDANASFVRLPLLLFIDMTFVLWIV